MRGWHWGMILVIFVIGYLVGAWMPGFGNRLYSMMGVQKG